MHTWRSGWLRGAVSLAGAAFFLPLSALTPLTEAAAGLPARPASPGSASSARPQLSFQEAADLVRTKVVVLKVARSKGRASGTGFLVGPGLVLTAGHVLSDPRQVVAWVNGVGYSGRVVGHHPNRDLGLLDLNAPDLLLKPVTLARGTADLPAGEPLMILTGPSQGPRANGEPRERAALPAEFRQRVLLGNPNGPDVTALELSVAVRQGDSGSPVVRVRDGSVVGVLVSRELPDDQGRSIRAYALPVESLTPWLPEVVSRVTSEREFYLFRGTNAG